MGLGGERSVVKKSPKNTNKAGGVCRSFDVQKGKKNQGEGPKQILKKRNDPKKPLLGRKELLEGGTALLDLKTRKGPSEHRGETIEESPEGVIWGVCSMEGGGLFPEALFTRS